MIFRSGCSPNACTVASSPAIPGMAISMNATSAASAGSIARNSSPEAASPTTSYPGCAASSPRSPLRKSEWSSTSMILHVFSMFSVQRLFLRRAAVRRLAPAAAEASPRTLTRMAACIPLPLAPSTLQCPLMEWTRETMFESPMPQSITAAGLKPQPLSE